MLERAAFMEIRNTAKEPDLEWLDTPELRSRLCLALRNVALYEAFDGSPSETAVKWIETVQRIHRLLAKREVAYGADLEALSAQTGWEMRELLEGCLQWPAGVPLVRELDGIRRRLRCWHCTRREFPLDATEKLCDECLLEMMDRMARKDPPEGMIFFRTYNSSRWCPHADSETALMTCDEYDFLADGRCSRCLREEYDRRHRGSDR